MSEIEDYSEPEIINGWIELCPFSRKDHVILKTDAGELNITQGGEIKINGEVYELNKSNKPFSLFPEKEKRKDNDQSYQMNYDAYELVVKEHINVLYKLINTQSDLIHNLADRITELEKRKKF